MLLAVDVGNTNTVIGAYNGKRLLDHFRLVAEREESKWALHKLRKFTGWYTHGVPHGKELRARINELPDVPSFLAAVEAFFDEMTGEARGPRAATTPAPVVAISRAPFVCRAISLMT